MYLNAVRYKDKGYLAPGSHAMELYLDKKDKNHALLDKHLAEVDKLWKKIEGRK